MSPTHDQRSEECKAARELLSRLGDKWSVQVVDLLGERKKRFNELRRGLEGISQRMLTLTLKGLQRDGVIIRTSYPTVPPRVEYKLTKLGRNLLIPIRELGNWSGQNRQKIQKAREKYDAQESQAG